jgi:tRNA pseudouridine38-40 synthase
MSHWSLTLAYDGTSFHGWQVQPNLRTVQGTLAATLHHITGESVLPQGSGRTDTGVHALGQVASFTIQANIPPANLLRALNRALPASIRILRAEHVPSEFHARHSAQRKTYEYRIFPRVPHPPRPTRAEPDRICPPTLAPYVWDCPWHVDLALANRAAAHILGTHDFTSFAATDPDLTVRSATTRGAPCLDSETWEVQSQLPRRPATKTIDRSEFSNEDGIILYRVTGSGFLHHMVRNLVGTFIDAASARIEPESIPTILSARNRAAAGQTAPARGLFLLNVEYTEPLGAPCLDSETWEQTTSSLQRSEAGPR